jgi:signal transduction histidine kinase/DNA-binding response OmpR family regulator
MRLNDWSIRQKLIGFAAATTAVALLLSGAGMMTYDYVTFRETKLSNVAAIAEVVGLNSAASLAFEDKAGAKKLLESLRVKPSIVGACLYRADGTLFVCYERPGGAAVFTIPAAREDSGVFEDNRLRLFRTIMLDGERAGRIYLESDLTELRSRLVSFAWILGFILMASIVVTLMLSSYLERLISGPILQLVEVAGRVSTLKDYTLRAVEHGTDEIGRLVNAFNEMLAGIQSRDQQLEQDLRVRTAMNAELAEAKHHAEEGSRAKSQFLANMSHEIRTPMNGIIGMTELTLATELDAEQREYLSMVKSSAEALVTVINDVLDFSKIEAGKLELDVVNFSLRGVLDDTIKSLALRAHQKGLELLCRVGPDVPETVLGDPGRLRQILLNLVGNAVKFTERGEVLVQVDLDGETADDVDLHFAVRDTGIGIPAEKQTSIFEAFAQADGTTTRKYGGTGLGLTIATKLVAMMSGQISVESVAGSGTTFHFTARLQRGLEVVEDIPRDLAPLRGLAVLVVDDNATNRRVLEELLGFWQMRPTTVDGAVPAVEQLERAHAAGDPFGLVLLDLCMPDVDGFALAEQIRERPHLAGSTILMLTSDHRPEDKARCRALGISAYLIKPIIQAALLAAITRVVGEAPAPSAPAAPAAAHKSPPRRILVAEDNRVNQVLVSRILQKQGHSIVLAADGKQAVAAFTLETFDLVLMDVQMPEMNGLEATTRIRALEEEAGGHIPIVALTAHAMSGDRERCIEAGMDGYLTKPLNPADLLRLVDVLTVGSLPPAMAPGRLRAAG